MELQFRDKNEEKAINEIAEILHRRFDANDIASRAIALHTVERFYGYESPKISLISKASKSIGKAINHVWYKWIPYPQIFLILIGVIFLVNGLIWVIPPTKYPYTVEFSEGTRLERGEKHCIGSTNCVPEALINAFNQELKDLENDKVPFVDMMVSGYNWHIEKKGHRFILTINKIEGN